MWPTEMIKGCLAIKKSELVISRKMAPALCSIVEIFASGKYFN